MLTVGLTPSGGLTGAQVAQRVGTGRTNAVDVRIGAGGALLVELTHRSITLLVRRAAIHQGPHPESTG